MLSSRLSEHTLNVAVLLVQEGNSQKEVCRLLRVSHSVIGRALERFNTTGRAGRVAFRHGGGKQRSTTPAQEHFVTLTARRNPTYNATMINNELRTATGVIISSQTVRRRLHASNLKARRRAAY